MILKMASVKLLKQTNQLLWSVLRSAIYWTLQRAVLFNSIFFNIGSQTITQTQFRNIEEREKRKCLILLKKDKYCVCITKT